MELRLSFLLFALFAASSAVPLWESNKCSQQCNQDPAVFRYDQGKTYIYHYEAVSKIKMNDEISPDIKVSAKAEISVHEPCEFSLQLRNVDISVPVDKFAYKAALEANALQFAFDDGVITSVCPAPEDQEWAVNIKKAILSQLQMSAKTISGSSLVQETDILGTCETTYTQKSNRRGVTTLIKSKNLNSCSDRQQTQLALFPRHYASSQNALRNAPLLLNDYTCEQVIDSDILRSSECSESNNFGSTSIETKTSLRFDRQISGQAARRLSTIGKHYPLLYAANPRDEKADEMKVMSILRDICTEISEEIKPTVPAKFNELVASLRPLPYSLTSQVYHSVKRGEICASSKLVDIFLDAITMDASEGSLKLITELVGSKDIKDARATYVFTLLAFNAQPSEASIRALAPLLERNDLPRQALLGISALVHNFCVKETSNCESNDQVKSAVDILVSKFRASRSEAEKATIVKALGNMGSGKFFLTELATTSSASQSLRVGAIKALKEMADDSRVRSQLLEIFTSQGEDSEIRISAYQTIMKAASEEDLQTVLQQLSRETDPQVGSYVESHLANLKETSDPHKKEVHLKVLRANVPEKRFTQQKSVNHEWSFFQEAMNLGGVLEVDALFAGSSSQMPRSVVANVSVPFFGKSVNLVEVGIRQVGLERELQRVIRDRKWSPTVLKDLVDFFTGSENQIQRRQGSAQGELYVNVDGKTIAFFDINDSQPQQQQDQFRQLMQQLRQRVRSDRAFAIKFLDTQVELPTSNGLPIKVDLNGTLVAGWKSDVKLDTGANKIAEGKFSPSVAVEISARITMDTRGHAQPGVKVVTRFSSAPVFDGKAKLMDDRLINLQLNLPKDSQTLVKFSSFAQVKEADGRVREIQSSRKTEMGGCTETLHRPLGIALCGNVKLPKPFISQGNPFLNGPMEAELRLTKSDSGMTGYTLQVEIPPQSAKEMKIFRASFNTPGSSIDREMIAEAQLSSPRDGRKEIRVQMKSPWKSASALASLKNNEQEKSVKAEFVLDNARRWSAEAGIDSDVKGRKSEYRPRIRVQWPGGEGLNLGGSISLAKGRKNQISIELNEQSRGSSRQYLRGQILKEGRFNSDFRLSSTFNTKLPGLELHVVGSAEGHAKQVSTDFEIQYTKPGQRRQEKIKLVGKAQDYSTAAVKKSSFAELTFTQWPKYNAHIQHTLFQKKGEHMENELTLAWSGALDQQKNKIHVLQVANYQLLRGSVKQAENRISLQFRDQVDYEVRTNYEGQRGETPKYKIELLGKDKKGSNNVKATVEYQHMSRTPLHLVMQANLITPSGRVMSYRDELRQLAAGEYAGHTSMQWEANKKAELRYKYGNKNDAQKVHQEIELELMTPNRRAPYKHQALLRMSRDASQVELRSQSSANNRQLYNVEVQHSRAQGIYKIESAPVTAKLETHAQRREALLQLSCGQWQHETRAKAQSGLQLDTETKKNGANKLNANFAFDPRQRRQSLRVNLPQGDAEAASNWANNQFQGNAKITTRNGFLHETNLEVSQSYEPVLTSNTVNRGQQVLSIDGRVIRKDGHLIVDANDYGTIKVNKRNKNVDIELANKDSSNKHVTNIEYNDGAKFRSTTKYNRRQLVDFDGEVRRSARSAKLNVVAPRKSASFEVSTEGGKFNVNTPNVDHETEIRMGRNQYALKTRHNNELTVDAEARRSGRLYDTKADIKAWAWQHSTKAQYEPKEQFKFEHSSTKRGSKILDLKSEISADQGLLQVNTQPFAAEAQYQPNQVKFSCNHQPTGLTHSTELSKWNVKSTTEKRGKTMLDVEGQYSTSIPCTLRIATPQVESNLIVDRRAKSVNFDASGKRNAWKSAWTHKTEFAAPSAKHVTFDTRTTTESGDVLAQLTAKHLDHETNVQAKSTQYGTAKFNLNRRAGNANWAIKCAQGRFDHESRISSYPQLTLNSNTQLSRGQRYMINAEYSPEDITGNAQMTAPTWNGKIEKDANSAEVNFAHIPSQSTHKTRIILTRDAFAIDSNTQHRNSKLAQIEGTFSKSEPSKLKIGTRYIQCEGLVDVVSGNEKSLNLKYKIPSGRKVLALASVDPVASKLHLDVKWDADSDPEKSLLVDLSGKQTGQKRMWGGQSDRKIQLTLSTRIGTRKTVSADLSLSRDTPLAGPHEISVASQGSRFTFEHVVTNNGPLTMNCEAKYYNNAQEKLVGKFVGSMTQVSDFNVDFSINSVYRQLNGIRFHAEHHQQSNQFNTNVLVNTGNDQEYNAVARFEHDKRAKQVSGNVAIQTPSNGKREVNAQVTYSNKQVAGSAFLSAPNGKQLQLDASASMQSGYQVQAELKSNVPKVPSVNFAAGIANQVATANVYVDGQRKLESRAAFNNPDNYNYSFDGSLKSAWTSDWTAKAETRLTQIARGMKRVNYKLDVERDSRKVFGLKVNGDKTAAEVSVDLDGQEAGKVSARDVLSGSRRTLELIVQKSRQQIAKVNLEYEQNRLNNGNHLLRICGKVDQCSTVAATIQTVNSNNKVVNIVLTNKGKSVEFAYQNEKTRNSLLNKAELVVNTHKIGYNVVANPKNVNVKILLPSRTVEANARRESTPDGESFTINVVPRTGKRFQLNALLKDFEVRDKRQMEARLELLSSSASAPLVLSTEMSLSRNLNRAPMTLTAQVEYANKKITLDGSLTKGQNANHTMVWNLHDNQRQIDATLTAHLAQGERVSSVGATWTNKQRQHGHYVALVDKRAQTADFWWNGQHARLTWTPDEAVAQFDNGDQLQFKQDKEKKCWEVSHRTREDGLKMRAHACVATEGDRLLRVQLDSMEEGQKVTHAQLTFDRRGSRVLNVKADWDPQQVGQQLMALANLKEYQDQSNSRSNEKPLAKEIGEKMAKIGKEINKEAVMPFLSMVADEVEEILGELARQFPSSAAIFEKAPISKEQLRQLQRKIKRMIPEMPSMPELSFSCESCKNAVKTVRQMAKKVNVNAITRKFKVPESVKSAVKKFNDEVKRVCNENLAIIGEALLSNKDVRQVYYALRDLWREIAREIQHVDINGNVKSLAKDALKLASSPSTWESGARVLTWDPNNGQVEFEVRAPKEQHWHDWVQNASKWRQW